MNKEMQELIKEFQRIARKRWVSSASQGFGAVGLTFERELNKKPDDSFFPDYYGVEIKCTTRFSRFPISLFSIAFDGPTFPEINRLIDKYGYYDAVYTDKKVLYTSLSCDKKRLVNKKYLFELDVSEEDEKLYLTVYDLNGKLIERESFVYLQSIYNHLMMKLNNLAVVYASKKEINHTLHFRYYKICLYQIKGFEKFLELLKTGKIQAYLMARVGKSGLNAGKYKNKNLIFEIKKDLIEELFTNIYNENYDETSSFAYTQFMNMPDIKIEEDM